MLKTIHLTGKFHKGSPCVALLGGFDGMHVGHKKLLEKAKAYGLPIGVMSLVGCKGNESLFTSEERANFFVGLGADFIFEASFSQIKDRSAEEFLQTLEKEFSPKVFICGDDFRFGKDALGDTKWLKRATQVSVQVEKLVKKNGEKVSATRIKSCLQQGDVKRANELLGERFFLIGEVFAERQVGRTIGFPTANVLYPADKFALKKGVYETRVVINGVEYKGITNFGHRPTFENNDVLTETYLDGFDGDLYGKKIKISFVRYLREIKKFDDATALKAQLTEDIRRVREND